MTPNERKLLAKEIGQVLKESAMDQSSFWIDGEKHYNDHIKFCGWIKFFEKCKEEAGSLARKLMVIGLAGLFLAGIYYATNGTFN